MSADAQLAMLALSGLCPFVLWASYRLFQRAVGSLSVLRPSPLSFGFWIAFQVQAFWGVHLMMWGARNYLGLERVDGEAPYLASVLAVDLAVVLVPLTMVVLARWFRFDIPTAVETYFAAPVEPQESEADPELLIVLGTWAVISIAVACYILAQSSPLVLFLLGDSEIADLARARVALIYASEWQRIVRNVLGGSFTALLVYVAYAGMLAKRKRRWTVLFWAIFIPALIIQASSLAKAPAAQLLIGVLLVHVLIRGALHWRTLALVISAIVVVLIGGYLLAQTDLLAGLNAGGVLAGDNPIGRTLIGQVVGMPNYFQIFPGEHSFLLGRELQALGMIGLQPESAAKLAMEILFPESVVHQTIGVQNTFFAGAAYANFGWPGVVLAPIWVGCVLFAVQRWALRTKKTPLGVGVMVWLLYQLVRAVGGGFVSEFTLNTNVIGTLVLAAVTLLAVRALSALRTLPTYPPRLPSS